MNTAAETKNTLSDADDGTLRAWPSIPTDDLRDTSLSLHARMTREHPHGVGPTPAGVGRGRSRDHSAVICGSMSMS